MSAGHHDGHLGAVYDAKETHEVAALYDSWAETYDAEMARLGYRHPSISLALLTRHLPRGAAPLLDAGAGTGLMGEWLQLVGYDHVDGLDISPGMLAVAAKKKCYKALHELALGGALPFEDGHYAGVVSTGVFTSGHVGVEGLDELVRICKHGGIIVLTVKNTLWENGFSAALAEFTKAGTIALIEETPPYVSMPGETGTIPSRAIALKRLATK